MAMEVTREEQDNRKKGAITSLTAHVAIFLIALLPWMTFPDPAPGPAGVLVSFGEPDQGMNSPDRAAPAPTETVEEVEEVEPEPVKEKPEKTKPKPKESTKVNTDDNSKERAIAKAKKEKADKKRREEKAEADRKQREADAKARAKREAEEAERARIAAAKAKKDAEAQALRDAIGGALGGSGNGGKPGDQGQPDGNPDGKVLDGVSTGSGEIGGGLGSRGLVSKPKITDNSQKTGDVVMKVCVDASGKVISAKYTQSGSTTSDASLVATAKRAAMKYKFSKGGVDKQCGTIKIKFKVR